MKKIAYTVCACLAAQFMIACSAGSSQSDQQALEDSLAEIARLDSIEAAEIAAAAEQTRQDSLAEVERQKAIQEADMALIRTFYKKCVLHMDDGYEQYGASHMTPAMNRKLIALNEYDGADYPAYWELRTGCQDGDGPSKITSIVPLGDGWYKVSYLDMGNKGSTKIKMEDGKLADFK